MNISFEPSAFDDFTQWAMVDKKCYKCIISLLKDITGDPYQGIGKPEALKYELKGYWSRRVSDEHRLVYRIESDRLIVVSCRYHYKK